MGRQKSASTDATALLAPLNPDASLATRHLWLIRAVAWVRGDGEAAGARARLNRLLDALEADPDARARWHRFWQVLTHTLDLAPLLADHGFSPRTSFFSELYRRVSRRVLPATPETTDPGELFDLVFPTDENWLNALGDDTLQRAQRVLFDVPLSPDGMVWMDAIAYSVGQVVAIGFSPEVSARMSDAAREARPFNALPRLAEDLRDMVLAHGPRSDAAMARAEALRSQLERCRQAANTVYDHLDEHGVSVDLVFRLRQLRERLVRIRLLVDVLQSEQPARPVLRVMNVLTSTGQNSLSVRQLFSTTTQLTAAKVAERHAESGSHYITRTRADHLTMLRRAFGGGAVLGFTTWFKFLLYTLGLSTFWAGMAAGVNYAVSFVLIMLLHWTVATKQPAVTAPAMAAKLQDTNAPNAVEEFVDEVINLLRSQLAAIVGNLSAVVPMVLLISWALHALGWAPILTEAKAHHVLDEQSLLGPAALFAAFTGVLLFASSIIAGWVENAFVFHRLDSAVRWNPRITQVLGQARAQRWSVWLRRNISALAANVSLGLLLGLVPAFAAFFGLGLEVRHVTLSTGQVAAAMVALGWPALATPAFAWVVAGIVVIGTLNLSVSFYLAFRTALTARNITGLERAKIAAAFRARLRQAPLSLFWVPKGKAPPPDTH